VRRSFFGYIGTYCALFGSLHKNRAQKSFAWLIGGVEVIDMKISKGIVFRAVAVSLAAFLWIRLIGFLGLENAKIALFVLNLPWMIIVMMWHCLAEKGKYGK
jgi:hypothetical protein